MTRSRYIELTPETVDALLALMQKFGETEIGATVARSIGLARVASQYLRDGKLTVLDPNATEDEDDQLVDIVVAREPSVDPIPRAA